MHKKLIMACMAIAAFAAFVMAPAASASPVLTDPVGTPVPVGASIKATNTGNTLFTIPGFAEPVTCTHAEFKGTVTQSGTPIKGTIPAGNFGVNYTFSGTAAGGDCTSPLGAVKPTLLSELCLETVKGTDNVTVTGCEGKPVVFQLDVTGLANCKYSTNTVLGTFKTNADATVNVSEQEAKLAEPNVFCPGSGKLDMDFDLTTTAGETILVS